MTCCRGRLNRLKLTVTHYTVYTLKSVLHSGLQAYIRFYPNQNGSSSKDISNCKFCQIEPYELFHPYQGMKIGIKYMEAFGYEGGGQFQI